MKNRCKNLKRTILVSLMACSLMAGTAIAAEPGALVSAERKGEQLILYVQNPGEIESVECQIGTELCGEVTYRPISELDVPVSTLLLLDNSLSTTEVYRPMVNEIMNNLVANRMVGEQFTIATFSDKITYLLEDSSDFVELKEAMDGITYTRQDTYLTDVLYELLEEWKQTEDLGYRRIVILSDGMDNKALGYTKEELYELLEESPCPIYTIGYDVKSDGGNERLENLFALSRLTQGDYWLLDEVENTMRIVNGIAAGNDMLRVTVDVPASLQDGMQKAIKLTMQVEGDAMETSSVISMPFSSPETEEPVKEEGTPVYLLVFGGVVGVAAIGAGIFCLVSMMQEKKKNSQVFESAPREAFHQAGMEEQPSFSAMPSMMSAMASTEVMGTGGDDQTAMIWSRAGGTYTLILTDQTYPIHRFETPLTGTVVIGRSREDGCTVVIDYDKSISRRHCQIRLENGRMFVRDLESRNKTGVNGSQVIGEAELASGSILSMGKVQMKVELRG